MIDCCHNNRLGKALGVFRKVVIYPSGGIVCGERVCLPMFVFPPNCVY